MVLSRYVLLNLRTVPPSTIAEEFIRAAPSEDIPLFAYNYPALLSKGGSEGLAARFAKLTKHAQLEYWIKTPFVSISSRPVLMAAKTRTSNIL
jgi:hypothetical protein